MSHNLGEVGENSLGAFCGPKGRRECYQIDGPQGIVQFSWEEWATIKEKIEGHHEKDHSD